MFNKLNERWVSVDGIGGWTRNYTKKNDADKGGPNDVLRCRKHIVSLALLSAVLYCNCFCQSWTHLHPSLLRTKNHWPAFSHTVPSARNSLSYHLQSQDLSFSNFKCSLKQFCRSEWHRWHVERTGDFSDYNGLGYISSLLLTDCFLVSWLI